MLTSLLFLSTTSVLLAQAGAFSSKHVKSVSISTFTSQVLGSEKATVVAFYAPWLAPEYERAAKNMKDLVNYVAIDCDEEPNKPLCGQYGVKGFPTIKLFPGKPKTSPRDYNGPRTAKDLADFSADQMPSFVKKFKTSAEILSFLAAERSKPAAILFTSASLVTPLYKGLSAQWHNEADLYAVRDTADVKEAKETLGVEKAPALLVLKPGQTAPIKFDGAKLGYASIDKFLSTHLKKSAAHSEL